MILLDSFLRDCYNGIENAAFYVAGKEEKAMEKEKVCSNVHECSCPFTDCKNHGRCCDCIANHREMGNLPNCYKKPE